MPPLRVLAVLVLALGFVVVPPIADAQPEYGHQIKRNHRAAIRAWRKVVPKKLRHVKWIYNLDGTSIPVQRVKIGEQTFLVGTVCEPHDCGDNMVAYAIAANGGRAHGLLRSANQAPDGDVTLGTPSQPERRVLVNLLESGAP